MIEIVKERTKCSVRRSAFICRRRFWSLLQVLLSLWGHAGEPSCYFSSWSPSNSLRARPDIRDKWLNPLMSLSAEWKRGWHGGQMTHFVAWECSRDDQSPVSESRAVGQTWRPLERGHNGHNLYKFLVHAVWSCYHKDSFMVKEITKYFTHSFGTIVSVLYQTAATVFSVYRGIFKKVWFSFSKNKKKKTFRLS